MAEIANSIINDKIPLTKESKGVFCENSRYQEGVKEIIGLYLLIPYINHGKDRLEYN